jgi:hypothetical protein
VIGATSTDGGARGTDHGVRIDTSTCLLIWTPLSAVRSSGIEDHLPEFGTASGATISSIGAELSSVPAASALPAA